MIAPTALSQCFAKQGVKIPIRSDTKPRGTSRKRNSSTTTTTTTSIADPFHSQDSQTPNWGDFIILHWQKYIKRERENNPGDEWKARESRREGQIRHTISEGKNKAGSEAHYLVQLSYSLHFFVHHFLFPLFLFPFSHRSFPLSFWTCSCCRKCLPSLLPQSFGKSWVWVKSHPQVSTGNSNLVHGHWLTWHNGGIVSEQHTQQPPSNDADDDKSVKSKRLR